jgi:PAS domain S-box-containing protein
MPYKKNIRIFVAGYFLGAFCFIAFCIAFFVKVGKLKSESESIAMSMQKINCIQHIELNLQKLETAQAAFLLNGDENILKDFDSNLQTLYTDTLQFDNIANSTPASQPAQKKLFQSIKQKIEFMQLVIDLRKQNKHDAADSAVRSGRGAQLSKAIQENISYFTSTNSSNLISATQKNNYNIQFIIWLVIGFCCILIIGYNLFANVLYKNLKSSNKKATELYFNNSILSNISDPIITTDNNYIITNWNVHATNLFGFGADEVIGRRLSTVLKTITEYQNLEEIRAIISTNKKWNGDLIYYGKNGKLIYANVSTSLVLNENDVPNGTVSVIRDITDKKIAENKLQKITENQESVIEKKVAELKTVFERTTDAFVSFDKDLNYVFVNEKAAALHNSSISEMTGRNILSYNPLATSREFYEALLTVLKDRKEIHNEVKYALTGQWFENWIYPDENGVSVYYRDITSRKTEEESIISTNKKLEELNNRFELILKGTNDAIWDWNLATNEIWGNDKYYELLKNKPDNKSNFEYFVERMHPDEAKKGVEDLSNAIAEKKETMISEYRFLNPENNWITLFNRQTILYNDEGKPYRILGALQEISEQKKIQEQILHEKELSDTLINSLPGVFYMFNKEGKYIRWNKNLLEITGLTDEQMLSTANPVNFVPEEQRALFAEKIANVFESGKDQVEGDLLVKDNQKISFYFTGIFIKYNGEDCMMGVGIDISEKVKSQKELRDLASHLQIIREEERSRIAREIHDELGQQLTGLKMDISWVNKKINPDSTEISSKMKDALSLIDDAVGTVRRIATQLRPSMLDDLGIISTMEWQSEEFQNRYQIQTIFTCNQTNISIDKEKSTAIFRIYQESLTNIARHAKATEVQTALLIEDNLISLEISDNGVGFSIDGIQHKKTLGLLGMKERTLLMGGTYQINSVINKGTSVLVKVPIDA